jgi:NAD(P)-dependent dehydrogenase (short-subunit alcohol dehydrogenase family)
MKQLTNKIALVAGGAGGVGEGIVKALLQEDAIVIVPSRSEEKISKLRNYTSNITSGNLITVRAAMNTIEGAMAVKDEVISKFGRIDILVASLGGWWQGAPIYKMDVSSWTRILDNNLTSHFITVRAFLPELVKIQHGTYIHINGFSAEQTYPGANAVAMAAAAQLSMVQTLHEELAGTGVQAFELILGPVLTRARDAGRQDWYSPEEIGNYIINLHTGKAANKNELVHRLFSKQAAMVNS